MPESALQHALKKCDLYPLLIITTRVLGRSGFGDIQILDRRTTKQKSRYGGFEIQCIGTFSGYPTKTVVKVINDAVNLRMLDENAGAVIRAGADMGLIVSPKHITRLAAKNLHSHAGVRVNVIDGVALAGLCERFEIGVRASGSVDYAYFEGLAEESRRFLGLLKKEGL